MKSRSEKAEDAVKLLEQIIRGIDSDDDQLRTLAATIADEIKLPSDAFVAGVPVRVTTIGYDGNPRVGLVTTCKQNGEQYEVGFGDVVFAPGSKGAGYSAVYRAWLGLPPHELSRDGLSRSRTCHKAEESDIDLAHPLDLVVLSIGRSSMRCRLPGTGRELTLRTAVRREAPGEIITVLPTKWWTRTGHPYLSGKVIGCSLDVRALGIVPLGLTPVGDWDPEEEYWGEEGEPLPDWAKPIIARGKRPAFEMEQVIPGEDPDDPDTDPIIEASELNAIGDRGTVEDILLKMLASDLRCLDAHAHLGNFTFDHNPKEAARHYRVGVGIGDLTLGDGFDGVLPWGFIDNRPFLRCLHGLALCLWRIGEREEAARTFERMLWLNPSDNQGARFELACVEDGREWQEPGY